MPEAIVPPPAPAAKSAAPPKPTPPAPKLPEKAQEIVPPLHEPEVHALQDDFDELAELDDKPKPDRKQEKQDKSEKTKEETEQAKVNGDKLKDQKPKDDEPKTNPELRKAYDSLKEKVANDYEPKLKRLPEIEAENKELKSRDESATKANQDKMASLEKRNSELENHIRFADYKQSKEYKELAAKLSEGWAGAARQLEGISISNTDPESGEVSERPLTLDDIAGYARLDPKLLWKKLKQDVPDAAERTTVINHVQKIQDLSDAVFKAEEKAKADSETHAKTQTEAQRQSQSNRAKLWKSTNDALEQKYPKYFGKDEADPEGNAVFDKGSAFADLVFSPADLTPERVEMLPKLFKEAIQSQKPFSPEAMVKLHAIAAKKLANHDRAITKLKAANARIEELEKSLKDYESSGPDNIMPGGRRNGAPTEMSDEEELRALDRQ